MNFCKHIVLILFIGLCSSVNAHEYGNPIHDEDKIILQDWKLPLTNKSNLIIKKALKELNCNLKDYLEMWGVTPSKISSYTLKNDCLIVKSSSNDARVTMIFLANLLNDVHTKKLSDQKLERIYTFKSQQTEDSKIKSIEN